MTTPTGSQLAQGIRQTLEELKTAFQDLDEARATQAPAGRWCPKEILSHLCGPEGTDRLSLLQAFLNQDNPTLDLHPGNSWYTEQRAKMTVAELLAEIENNYQCLAKFAENLTPQQLQRQAHIPALKDSPLGENPTLGAMLSGLSQHHVQMHLGHLREVLGEKPAES